MLGLRTVFVTENNFLTVAERYKSENESEVTTKKKKLLQTKYNATKILQTETET
jgi:hypothetical protein